MAELEREAVVAKVREIAERVGASEGIEVVDVEYLGSGHSRVLRIFIDKAEPIDTAKVEARSQTAAAAPNPEQPHSHGPQGVTHTDCEFISHQVGTILDVEDVIPGDHYTLEVSSPGVERKLSTPREFERFVGQKVKVVLRQPVENQRKWVGALKSFSQGIITLEPVPGKSVAFPLEQVEKANLKFDW